MEERLPQTFVGRRRHGSTANGGTMKAVNEVKPINVLARFIAAWVREHGENGAPFDSFEALRTEPIEQKDVERWILGCNYAYYRVGDAMLEADLFPDDGDAATELLTCLDTQLKSIRDSNPLNLRSKQPEAIAGELGKDWPPFCRKSRSDIRKSASGLKELSHRFAQRIPGLTDVLREVATELAEEARWYRALAGRHPGAEGIAERGRVLVPLWCLKGVNPLFTLLMWRDEDAIDELARQLSAAFSANGYPSFDGGSRHDAYRGVVRAAQQLYLDGLAGDGTVHAGDALDRLPLCELADLLGREFFTLGHPAPSRVLPPWLTGKALLIWNVVACAALGPREAIRPSGPNRTATTLVPAGAVTVAKRALRGEVLLRRCLKNGEREVAGALQLDGAEPAGTVALGDGTSRLWYVLGSAYDEGARVPEALALAESALADHFLPTFRLDDRGAQTEGAGDSRYHAALTLVWGEEGWQLSLEDLGSKNGTCVVRREGADTRYLVLAARTLPDAATWARSRGVDSAEVTVVDRVALERGDVIQLCSSRFELL